MGILATSLNQRLITCMGGKPSEVTYFIDGKAYCFRPLSEEGKEDQFCSRAAGWGTDHLHDGACKFHGGNVRYNRLEHGLYANVLKRKLRKQFIENSLSPDLLNLAPELILQKTLLEKLLEELQHDMSVGKLDRALTLLRDIATTVEKIERINSQKTLTIAKVKLILSLAMAVWEEFVQPGMMPLFVKRWQEKVAEELGIDYLELTDDNVRRMD